MSKKPVKRGIRLTARRKRLENWAERIEWCTDAQMSIQDIADEINEKQTYIRDLVSGRKQAPTGMAAVRLFNLSEKYKPADYA